MTAANRVLLLAGRLDSRATVSLALDLARTLVARAREVRVIHAPGPRTLSAQESDLPRIVFDPPAREWALRLAVRRLAGRVRESAPQIVHAVSPDAFAPAHALARILGVPWVATVGRLPRTAQRPASLEPRGADAVLVPSQSVRESLVNRGGVPWHLLHLVDPGVDLARFEESRAASDTGAFAPVVASIGTLEPWRGQTHFLEAAKRVLDSRPDTRFLVAGEGVEEDRLRARARDLSIETNALVVTNLADYDLLFGEIDVFVSPAEEEGLGRNILLAMAAANPVIATAVGSVYERVEDGKTGILVPSGDPGAIAAATLSLLADPARAREMGLAGRKAACERFGLARMATAIEDAYGAVLASRRASAAV